MLLSQTFSRPIVPNHLALTPSQPTTGIFAPLKCYTASRFLFAFDSDEAKKNQWPIRKKAKAIRGTKKSPLLFLIAFSLFCVRNLTDDSFPGFIAEGIIK
ncbi:hypothetical protein V6Z12_A10G081000 [Gossypium hirsutum]